MKLERFLRTGWNPSLPMMLNLKIFLKPIVKTDLECCFVYRIYLWQLLIILTMFCFPGYSYCHYPLGFNSLLIALTRLYFEIFPLATIAVDHASPPSLSPRFRFG